MRLIRWLGRLAPRWRREEWIAEWEAELHAQGGKRTPLRIVAPGVLAHLAWLWSHEWSLDMFRLDVRYALRTLRRDRAISVAAILTLALGIGAATGMFAVIDAVLLRSFAFADASRIVAVWPRVSVSPRVIDEGLTAGPFGEVFDAAGAYSGWGFTLTGGEQAEMVRGARITPGLFRLLDVRPLHGRLFREEDQRPGLTPVALVSEGIWRRRLGGDPAAVGRDIQIGGVAHQVVGVLPANVAFPDRRSEVWLPITLNPAAPDYNATFAVRLARLAPGISVRQAEERLRVHAEQLQRDTPRASDGRLTELARVIPLREHFTRDAHTPLLLLLGSVGILALVACANVGNLLLTRASARRTEMALRAALGADRVRLFRQLAVEGLLLSAAGCLGGLGLAWLLLRLIKPFAPAELPNLEHAAIDPRAILVAAAIATTCALLFAAAPGLAARRDPRALLGSRGQGRSDHGAGLRRAFVFGQIVLAMFLAIPAALLARSFVNLSRVDPGFDAAPVLTMRVSAPAFAYREPGQIRGLFERVTAALAEIPGVAGVGMIQLLPLSAGNWDPNVRVEGMPDDAQYADAVNWRVVNPPYFSAMDIPLRSGRLLQPEDDARGIPVAVVNETFARLVFRGGDPVGKRIRTGFEPRGTWVTVVGVVGDVRQHALALSPNAEMYRPFAQHPVSTMVMMIKARDPLAVPAPARAALAAIDRNLALAEVEPMSAVVQRGLSGTRLPLMLAAALAAIAVTIGLVGIAGVLAFDVAERKPEIGIRLALGETPARVRNRVLGGAAVFGAAAIATGAGAALLASAALASMLYGVTARDPITVAGVSLAALLAVLGAAYVPAVRAAGVDPVAALRGD